jgi:hypothetical protein
MTGMTTATAPPNAPRVIATAGNYLQLVQAFRARLAALDIPYSTVDAIAGWAERYTSKLLAEEPSRNLGPLSLDCLLGATGLKIALIEDPETLEKIKRHRDFVPRKYGMRTTGKQPGYVVQRKTYEQMRSMASEGGRARAEKLSATKLKGIASKAAKARWSRPKLTEITPKEG